MDFVRIGQKTRFGSLIRIHLGEILEKQSWFAFKESKKTANHGTFGRKYYW